MADFELRAAPRPKARLVNRAAGRVKVAREGVCRVCGSARGLERHHLVPRSLRGDDVDENIVPLCGECHGEFERGPQQRKLVGQMLRRRLLGVEVAYVIRKKGVDFLSRYYPS